MSLCDCCLRLAMKAVLHVQACWSSCMLANAALQKLPLHATWPDCSSTGFACHASINTLAETGCIEVTLT